MKRLLRSRWVLALVAVCVCVVTASLGWWQLGRAAQKEQWQQQRMERDALPPLDWAGLPPIDSQEAVTQWHDRRVVLRGRWLHEATVFLDNRPMQGRSGFVVLTPLQAEAGGPVLWVQRGWVPRDVQDRTRVPEVPRPEGWVQVWARLAPPPSRLYELAPDEAGRIRQNVELSALSKEWGLRAYSMSAQQTAPDGPDDGLQRDWYRAGADVHKHYGYAVQWFGLCGLVLILYVWFQFIAPRRRP